MKVARVAFYVTALGLLVVGLRELLTGFEENRCSMTYMFEYPEYRRVALPRRVARSYPAYGLYLYGEGLYAQETQDLKLTGTPVLFLPGNAGSYKQARSLGSVALRKAENMEGGIHLNVFTVDFNEELVALYGGSLLRQTHFLHESIKAILRLYKHLKIPPQSVAIVGHSMGGVVARALFTLPRFNPHLVSLIITQASPHLAPVLGLDPFLLDVPEAWTEVNTLRLSYSTPTEGQVRYFVFALSSRRKAYSHFYCRSNNLETSSWVFGCMQRNGSSCLKAVDLSSGTELLPPYKVLILRLGDLSSVSHLVVSASNLNGKPCTVECFTASEVLVNSSGLLHNIQLLHFHQVYQAFRISLVSQCKVNKDRLPSVYRMKAPWFREDSFTTVSVPSVAEISGMLHTSRPDNTSSVLLQLHTAPNCQYKVSVRTSLPKVLGQALRFCGPMVPVYTAVTLLLACGGQLLSVLKSRSAVDMSQAVAGGLQPHKINLPVYVLSVVLSCSWFQEFWSILSFPPVDTLPPTFPDGTIHEGVLSPEDWPHLLSPLIYVFGAAVAYWGSTLLRLLIQIISLVLAPLHRPSVSRDCGTLRMRTLLFISLCLVVMGGASCGALAIFTSSLLHLYRVVRLQMTERSLSHMLNLAPQKPKPAENGSTDAESQNGAKDFSNAPLLSECALQEVRSDLQLHFNLSGIFMLPVMLGTPSLLHWIRNLRFSTQLDPDPLWPHIVPLIFAYLLLINCNSLNLSNSRLLPMVSFLPLPLAVTMATFSSLHLYRITYFLSAALVPLALCCLL
uniref:GPI inositol-deacylase n=2 Tax=Iconisemion striatum TaxID=60296 RepID=A0A1A7X8R4_9TELE